MAGITKRDLLEAAARGEGPLGKAKDDEPVFCLVAHDNLADELVDTWAIRASLLIPAVGSEHFGHKVSEAVAIAEAMRAWPYKKDPD
jgi:hypothetical protein